MNSNVRLSIIVVNWNTRDLLENCLSSINDHVGSLVGVDIEVIVVDNASTDGSVDMVREKFSNVKILDQSGNLGFVKANNIGFRHSSGQYVLLLNSDTRLLNSEISDVLDYMDVNPGVGIVTAKVLNEDGTFQTPFRRLPHPLGACIRHTFRLIVGFNTPFHKHYMMSRFPDDLELDIESATGAYLFIRRDVIRDDTILDEDIFMYYEDTLLCHNILKQGYKISYLPIAPIIHYGGRSARKIKARAAAHSILGSFVYFRKTQAASIFILYRASVKGLVKFLKYSFMVATILPSDRFSEKYKLFSQVDELIGRH